MGIFVPKKMSSHQNKIIEINEHFKEMATVLSGHEASESLFTNVETVVGSITVSYGNIETLNQALIAVRKCTKYIQEYLL